MAEGDGGTYQPVDQRAIDAMRMTPGFTGFVGDAVNLMTRAMDNAALAQAQSAVGSMRVEPDKVDELGRFFDDEARALEKEAEKLQEVAFTSPPGSDPVSTQATMAYNQVAAGDDRSAYENLMKLAALFKKASLDLHDSARQNRLDDQNAADSFGGNIA
ncbi:hypothetical protein [Saccharopolyspora hordei]|uniref:PE domain-containing protein n=1 Tax=Saccharopolyspora hordei TaxID=1838 RepID=A0A853AKX9_9PSEU|nr:hypothetical protein [Saccharopolyspora hordei]NYI83709.1 hypothetical protein [Saccharopolyspora hordei]